MQQHLIMTSSSEESEEEKNRLRRDNTLLLYEINRVRNLYNHAISYLQEGHSPDLKKQDVEPAPPMTGVTTYYYPSPNHISNTTGPAEDLLIQNLKVDSHVNPTSAAAAAPACTISSSHGLQMSNLHIRSEVSPIALALPYDATDVESHDHHAAAPSTHEATTTSPNPTTFSTNCRRINNNNNTNNNSDVKLFGVRIVSNKGKSSGECH